MTNYFQLHQSLLEFAKTLCQITTEIIKLILLIETFCLFLSNLFIAWFWACVNLIIFWWHISTTTTTTIISRPIIACPTPSTMDEWENSIKHQNKIICPILTINLQINTKSQKQIEQKHLRRCFAVGIRVRHVLHCLKHF